MLQRLLCLLIAAALILSCAALAEGDTYDVIYSANNPIPEIAERVRPAVVEVLVYAENWDPVTRVASVDDVGLGSGCYIIADEDGTGGYILTNNHVTEKGDLFKIRWLSGEEMDAELLGSDDGTDIAVLRFEEAAPEGVAVIPMGDSDSLRIGELAICIGNPAHDADSVLTSTVTAGIISGVERQNVNADNFTRNTSVIQTDAAINTGNSGGALLNSKGELMGIPTLKFMFDGLAVYEGLGFCVPINTIRDFITQIIDTGAVIRPRIGLTITNIDGPDEPMRRYPPIGAQVYAIDSNGSAAKAGVQEKDVITHVNGVRVKGLNDMLGELDKCGEGDTVKLKICRYKYDENGQIVGGYEEVEADVRLEIID